MKRFVTLVIALALMVCGQGAAQTIPEWMSGDFVGEAGPIDIQLKLVDFNSPWSTPDPTMNHVLVGALSFLGEGGADLTVSQIGTMRCGSAVGCYAYNMRPLVMRQMFPWSVEHAAYIWVGGYGMPVFSALTVDLGSSSAYWSYGRFRADGFSWVIHESAFYSLYLIEPLTIPIFPAWTE